MCFGYLSRQIQRVEHRLDSRVDRLDSKLDGFEARLSGQITQLTERYIAHLERHPH